MPVFKYRSVMDMPPPPRCPDDEELVARIRAVWDRVARLAGGGYPPGVHRFRSIQEAQEARERVVRDRMRRLRREVG